MGKIKTWDELTIRDNFLFLKVMQNKRLCKHLIEKILGIRIRQISYPVTEKAIDIRYDSKSVRLDVFVEDDEGVLYDIEMQTTDGDTPDELPKRARCYQAMMDNPKLKMGDETTKIFLNSQGNREELDADIAAFLDYVNGLAAKGHFAKSIDQEVQKVKEHKETRWEYMTLMMELKKQWTAGHAEGKAEGKAEGEGHIVRNMLKSHEALDKIKAFSGWTADQIHALAQKNGLAVE